VTLKRREFITVLGGAAALTARFALPLTAKMVRGNWGYTAEQYEANSRPVFGGQGDLLKR
jgi:hypothetical protein